MGEHRLRELAARIHQVYLAQFRDKLHAICNACPRWRVE